MKNNLFTLSIIAALLLVVSGCGLISRTQKTSDSGSPNAVNKDKSIADKTIDVAVGDEKIGVPACDELLDFFAQESKSTDENYFTKATRQYFMNKIRENIKQTIEENKDDKAKMAKECKKYRGELDKFKAEEEGNKQ